MYFELDENSRPPQQEVSPLRDPSAVLFLRFSISPDTRCLTVPATCVLVLDLVNWLWLGLELGLELKLELESRPRQPSRPIRHLQARVHCLTGQL